MFEDFKPTNPSNIELLHKEMDEWVGKRISSDRSFASQFLQGFIYDALVDIEDEWKENRGAVMPPLDKLSPEQINANRELLRLAIEKMGEPKSYLEKCLLAMGRGLLSAF